jgi:hypothetical protein
MSWHLAQVNIARTKAPFSAPVMSGLTARLAEMNALAESSPGFVWRFIAESDEDNRLELFADYVVPFEQDCLFFNMSVWKSVEDLQHYAFKTAHVALYCDRHTWMNSIPRAAAALWWLPEEKIPSVADARARLLEVDQSGPTAFAFTFAKPFPPPANAGANN